MKQDALETNLVEDPPPGFPVCDSLRKSGGEHCVSMFILDTRSGSFPDAETPSATMTLIEHKGRCYGVTCQHVMKIVDAMNAKADGVTYDVCSVIDRMVWLGRNRFVQPEQDVAPGPSPDLAIRELDPNYISAIGKKPLAFQDPSIANIVHGIAVGYPTGIKENTKDGRVCIPCVYVLGELPSITEKKAVLFSVLDHDPGIDSFSGMSGGPIYWSDQFAYGLLGITYEAASPREAGIVKNNRIHIIGELLSLNRFELFLSQIPKLY